MNKFFTFILSFILVNTAISQVDLKVSNCETPDVSVLPYSGFLLIDYDSIPKFFEVIVNTEPTEIFTNDVELKFYLSTDSILDTATDQLVTTDHQFSEINIDTNSTYYDSFVMRRDSLTLATDSGNFQYDSIVYVNVKVDLLCENSDATQAWFLSLDSISCDQIPSDGNYYVFVYIDANGSISETNESNNTYRYYNYYSACRSSSIAEEKNKLGEVNIFPNPTNDEINVQLTELPSEDVLANIYDVSGKLIIQKKVNSLNTNIDLRNVRRGYYMISLVVESEVLLSKKVMKL